jgi:hypothetical protein
VLRPSVASSSGGADGPFPPHGRARESSHRHRLVGGERDRVGNGDGARIAPGPVLPCAVHLAGQLREHTDVLLQLSRL